MDGHGGGDRVRPGAAPLALVALLALPPACGGGAPPAPPGPAVAEAPFDHAYAAWDALLARHVDDGRVDYSGLAADRPALEGVIAALAAPGAATVAGWSKAERTAYWINAYNALTLRVVLDHPGVASIRDIGLLPYTAFREPVASFRARPERLSLDDVEKGELLGSDLWDARVHVAVSCASASCPALLARAWRADDLDATFASSARAFLADTRKNRWEPATGVDPRPAVGTLRLSQIFEWYEADFVRAAGSVSAWVARYGPPEMAAAATAGAPIAYIPYDWSLNAR